MGSCKYLLCCIPQPEQPWDRQDIAVACRLIILLEDQCLTPSHCLIRKQLLSPLSVIQDHLGHLCCKLPLRDSTQVSPRVQEILQEKAKWNGGKNIYLSSPEPVWTNS